MPTTTRPAAVATPEILRFGLFELDAVSGELTRSGMRLRLAPQPTLLLELLAANPGRLVTRDQIRQCLWGDGVHVDFDQSVNTYVRDLRQVLGDDARSPRFIETVPRRGYRFVAPVQIVRPAPPRPGRGYRWAAAAVLLVGVALLVMAGWTRVARSASRLAADDGLPQTLVILPFDNLTGDVDQNYFGAGLTDELISRLAGIRPQLLSVIAYGSAVKASESLRDGEDANLSGADMVLDGGIRRLGDQVRLTARLVDPDDGRQLWAETFERSSRDLLALQSDLAGRIADSLTEHLWPEIIPEPPATAVAEAYDAYLKGRYLAQQYGTAEQIQSLDLFREAIDYDPDFGAAHANLALAYSGSAWWAPPSRLAPAEAYPRAIEAAARALEIDSELAEAHLADAIAQLYYRWDFEAADTGFRRAAELAPGSARVHGWRAAFFAAVSDHDRAIAAASLARELDPLSFSARSDLCWYFDFAGRFEEAKEECRRAVEMEPSFTWARWGLVEAQRHTGDLDQAARTAVDAFGATGKLETSSQADPDDVLQALWSGLDSRLEGAAATGTPGDPYFAAVLDALQGDVDGAFEWLDQAYEMRSGWMVYLGVDPRLSGLHDDPRFRRLAERVGLPRITTRAPLELHEPA